MTTVSHGADAERLRGVGQELSTTSQRLADVATSGRTMADVLVEHWSGPDLEYFVGQGWPGAERVVQDSSELLRAMGEAAVREAGQQDDASAGGGASGGSGGAAGERDRGRGDSAGDDEQDRDPEEYGDLPPEVRQQWDSYDDEQKRMIVRQIIRERAEHYGVDMPSVRIDDSIDGNGVWRELPGPLIDQVVINEDVLEDPMILHTVFHEMRHAGQWEAMRDADPFLPWQDPTYDHGFTPEEVQEWKDNQSDYQPAPTDEEWENDPEAAQEKYDRYFDQPVEVDAREEGAEFVEGMTPEELDRLLDEAEENRPEDIPNPAPPH